MNPILFWLIVIAVLIAIVHFMNTSKLSDGMGRPGKEYKEYLKKGKKALGGISGIPPPLDGIRDEEVEALLRSGNIKEARELLIIRMEQARMAPIGRDAKIARVSHYMSIMDNPRR